MGKYYYEFVVGDFDMNEQTTKIYEAEGLDENGISELETRIMNANPRCAYCKYIGEGSA